MCDVNVESGLYWPTEIGLPSSSLEECIIATNEQKKEPLVNSQNKVSYCFIITLSNIAIDSFTFIDCSFYTIFHSNSKLLKLEAMKIF